MARVDYADIQDEIADILRNDSSLSGLYVVVEEEPPTNVEMLPWCGIELVNWRGAGQLIAAGKIQKIRIRYSILIVTGVMEHPKDARRTRDDLLGKVQIALLKNPTLNTKAELFRMEEGGEFSTERTETGTVATGEIILDVEKRAQTA